jgi:hypothetical protein
VARRQASSRRKRASTRALAAIKEKLGIALAATVSALHRAEIPFAIVGGLAVGARSEPHVTRNIDLVFPIEDDAAAEARIFVLEQLGFRVRSLFEREGNGISVVRTSHRRSPDVLVDFMISISGIESEITRAASIEHVLGTKYPVAQRWHLLAMKVLANRLNDQADLQHLIEASNANELKKTEAALRLMKSRGAGGKRNLISELRAHVRAVRATEEKPNPRRLAKLRRAFISRAP